MLHIDSKPSLYIDLLPATHDWLRVRREIKGDPEMEAILRFCPEIIKNVTPLSTALYIGASRWRCCLLDELLYHKWQTDVIEIDKENCRLIQEWYPEVTVYNLDIRNVTLIPNRYDLAIWVHGPEHISEKEAIAVIEMLKNNCSIVLLAYPIEQKVLSGPAYGNEAERHLWSIPKGWSISLGFTETSTGDDRVAALWTKLSN